MFEICNNILNKDVFIEIFLKYNLYNNISNNNFSKSSKNRFS